MRLYRISVTNASPELNAYPAWVGTQSDAASTRRKLNSAGFKRDNIVTDEIEVPTHKTALIDFLNNLEAGNIKVEGTATSSP
jgi:hypothetical protein